MALIFYEGFDYVNTFLIYSNWNFTNNASTSTNTRYSTGRAWFGNNSVLSKVFTTNYTTGVVGFAFMYNGSIFESVQVMYFVVNAVGDQLRLNINQFGNMQLKDGNNNLLATGTANLVAGTFYYIELKFKITSSLNPGECVLYVNGIKDFEVDPGTSTKTQSQNYYNQIVLGGSGNYTNNFFYDDLYLLDWSGSSFNDVLGEVRIQTQYPSGNGSASQFVNTASTSVNNYTYVSDNNDHDGDSSYVQSDVIGNEDLYAYNDLAASTEKVLAVKMTTVTKKTDTDQATIDIRAKIGGTDYLVASHNLPSGYTYLHDTLLKQPDGVTDWTVPAVNNGQFGYGVGHPIREALANLGGDAEITADATLV